MHKAKKMKGEIDNLAKRSQRLQDPTSVLDGIEAEVHKEIKTFEQRCDPTAAMRCIMTFGQQRTAHMTVVS